MAFDATVGGIDANSYVNIVDADLYFTDMGSPAEWTGATVAQKQAALMYATMWLDSTFTWYSTICLYNQRLGWPRFQFIDTEGRFIGGSGVIPKRIKDATCELALEHIKNSINSSDLEGVQSESVGSSSITYSKASKSYSFIKMSLNEYGTPSKANSKIIYRA